MNGHGDPELAAHFAADLETGEPDPAPEWQSWPMITTPDGEHRFPLIMNGERKWFSLNALDRDSLTDAEIAALGPVRRCVPVTLPDERDFDPDPLPEDVSLDEVRAYAAAMLAAALRVERAGS